MKRYKFRKSFRFNGKKYDVYANTEPELYSKLERKKMDLECGHILVESSMLFKDWSDLCIETYKIRCSEKTKQDFIYIVNANINPVIGSYPLKSIKPLHCQNVINSQIGKSKSQITKVYQALQFLFKKAKETELINVNPAANIEKPPGKTKKRRALTSKEQALFTQVAVTDRRFYGFLLMLYCGCRPSEAYNCMSDDIKITNGIKFLHIRGTKSRSADRLVPLLDGLYELFKDIPKGEYIAQTEKGNRITENYRRKIWNRFKNIIDLELGAKTYRNKIVDHALDPDVVQYYLRHTYCTNLAKNNIDIRIAQKLMGHSDIWPTANIYTHIDDTDLENAATILNSACPLVLTSSKTVEFSTNPL